LEVKADCCSGESSSSALEEWRDGDPEFILVAGWELFPLRNSVNAEASFSGKKRPAVRYFGRRLAGFTELLQRR
jgi:hypothetical protein